MNTMDLQHKLRQLTYLLPSQRELLERLLFQLAFNQFRFINLIGAAGSGRSTLALALAELFSEQFNVGLLSNDVNIDDAEAKLSQQWFGDSAGNLIEQVERYTAEQPLLLVIDDIERFSPVLQQRLLALPALVITCSSQIDSNAGLNLTIARITQTDAQQLLSAEKLSALQLTERLATADGNLHLIMQPVSFAQALANLTESEPKPRTKAFWATGLAVGALAVVITMLWFYWPAAPDTVDVTDVTTKFSSSDTDAVQRNEAEPQAETNPAVSDKPAHPPILTEHAAVDTIEHEPESIISQMDGIVVSEVDETLLQPQADADQQQTIASPADPSKATEQASETSTVDGQAVRDELKIERDKAELGIVKPGRAEPDSVHQSAQLLAMDRQHKALQLAVLSSERALNQFRQRFSNVAILSYQRRWQGKEQIVAVLAPYTNTADAKQHLQSLPEALRSSGPFVKTLQSVQAEIKAFERSTAQPMQQPMAQPTVN